MARVWTRITGTGASGYKASGDYFKLTADAIPLQYDLELSALGQFCRNRQIGGSKTRGILAATVQDAIDAVDFTIDNTSTQYSGATSVVKQVIVWCRVDDATISVTPKIRNITDSSDAVVGTACSAIAADFSGTNSKQTLALTLASGVKTYRLMLTPSAATFQVFGQAWLDLYVQTP